MPLKRRSLTEEEARLKMADLCARAEQCEYDISQKLYRLGLPENKRVKIINFLKEHNFLDNYRYAVSYAKDKCRFSGWGPYKIRMGLAAKRISRNQINEALEEVDTTDWAEAISRAAATKAKSLDLLGEDKYNNRVKLARFLLSRGFPYSEVKEAVKEEAIRQHLLKQKNRN